MNDKNPKNKLIDFVIDEIRPASYNPRRLPKESFVELQNSLRELGQMKPVLIRESNKTILAGHQRTKVMKSMGWNNCWGFALSDISIQDEVRFNQLHNLCEFEISPKAPKVRINSNIRYGISIVQPSDIEIVERGDCPVYTNNLYKMIARYGNFGMPIVDSDNNVIVSSAYAFSTKLCNVPTYVLKVNTDKANRAVEYFAKDYGQFYYDALKKNTYIQGLAQMHREANDSLRSVLYCKCVHPYLATINKKNTRLLDFGAGEYYHAKELEKAGWDIDYVDPYHKEGFDIQVGDNKRRFLNICQNLKNKGLYDIVICDSVLNSVDSVKAWNDVVNTCIALLRPNGHLFISGRRIESAIRENNHHTKRRKQDTMYFLDGDGFTAQYRSSNFFYQKFDKQEEIFEIAKRAGEKVLFTTTNSSWQLHAIKTKELDEDLAINALRSEWNMILPNNISYGLGEKIEEAYRCAIQKTL